MLSEPSPPNEYDIVISSKFTAGTSVSGEVYFTERLENIIAFEVIYSSLNLFALTNLNPQLGNLFLLQSNALGGLLSKNPFRVVNTTNISTPTLSLSSSNTIDVGMIGINDVGSGVGSTFSNSLNPLRRRKLYFNAPQNLSGFDWNLAFFQAVTLATPRSIEIVIRFYTNKDKKCHC